MEEVAASKYSNTFDTLHGNINYIKFTSQMQLCLLRATIFARCFIAQVMYNPKYLSKQIDQFLHLFCNRKSFETMYMIRGLVSEKLDNHTRLFSECYIFLLHINPNQLLILLHSFIEFSIRVFTLRFEGYLKVFYVSRISNPRHIRAVLLRQ